MSKSSSEFRGIPIVPTGTKYQTEAGFNAIKNGIKSPKEIVQSARKPKPDWLRAKFPGGTQFKEVKKTVKEHRLATVCEESMCPNIGECWNAGTATIMVMGAVCTRACRFCAVDTGNPKGWLDAEEPENTARAVELMDLNYVVLTSVDRDDLADGGAQHYAECIRAIKRSRPQTAVEALTPDFGGSTEALETLLRSGLDVFAQNVETVERLTHPVRDPRAGYWQTIDLLRHSKQFDSEILTKTSLMLGLGETESEVLAAMADLRAANVDILTLGQYLQPTPAHLRVEEYIHPDKFAAYRQAGLERGFVEVVAGPLVRSSYRAEQVLLKNNVGLEVEGG